MGRKMSREITIDQAFNLQFDLVRKLEAVGTKKLDAIVKERIVRGRNHHADIGTQ